jgi:hypothetical protein
VRIISYTIFRHYAQENRKKPDRAYGGSGMDIFLVY